MKSLVSSSDENASDQESSMDKYAIYSKDNNKLYELKNSRYMKKKIISAIKKSLKSNNNSHSLTLNNVSVSEEKEIGDGGRQSLNIRIALDDKLFYSSGDAGGPINIETFKLSDSTPTTKCTHCSGKDHEPEDVWPAYFVCVKCGRKEKRKWYHENCKEKCCTTTSIYCDNCLRFKLTSINDNIEVLDNKFVKYMYVVTCPNGGGISLHMDYEKIMNFTEDEQNIIAKEFLKEAFKEDKKGFAQFTIAIVHNGASYMPDLLKLLAELHPMLPVKTTKLKCNTETEVMDLGTYYTKVKETYSNGTFAFNPLNEIQAASVKNDECGAYLPELLSLLEKSAFLTQVLPWSEMTTKRFKSPHESDDGPIFWCRPGEQIVSLDRNSKRNRWNADEIETFLKERQQNLKDFCEKRYIVEELKKYRRSYSNREFLFEDRTRPHADQVWGNHFECTAAVGVIQAIHPDEIPEQNRACKEIVVFHAKHFEMLEALLHIDVTAAPKQQCAEWLDDAKLNMIRQMNIKYSKLHLYDNDIYFIPRKIVHQFKTISATLSVAWHTRLIEYYLEPDPPPVSEPVECSETAATSAVVKKEPLSDHDDDSSSSCSSDSLPPPAKKRKTPTATPKKKHKLNSRSRASTDNEFTPKKQKKPRSRSGTPQKRAVAEKTPRKRAQKTPKKVLVLEEEDEDIKPQKTPKKVLALEEGDEDIKPSVAPAPSQQKSLPEIPPQPTDPPQQNDSATSSRSASPVAAKSTKSRSRSRSPPSNKKRTSSRSGSPVVTKSTKNKSRSRSPPSTKKGENDSSRSSSPVSAAKPRKKKSRSRSPPSKKPESDSSRSGSPVGKPGKKKSHSKSPPPTKKRESQDIDAEPSKKKKHRSRSRSRSRKRSDTGVEKDHKNLEKSKKKKKDRSRSKSPKKSDKSKDTAAVSSSGSDTVKNDISVTPSKSKKSSHSSSSKKHADDSKSSAGSGKPEKHRKKNTSDKDKKSRSDSHRSDSSPKRAEREKTPLPTVSSSPTSQPPTPAKDCTEPELESRSKSPPSSTENLSTEKCPSPSIVLPAEISSPSQTVPSAADTKQDDNVAESPPKSSPLTEVADSAPASSPPPEPIPEEATEEPQPSSSPTEVITKESISSPVSELIPEKSPAQSNEVSVKEPVPEKSSALANQVSVKAEPLDDVVNPSTTVKEEPGAQTASKDTSISKPAPEKPVRKPISSVDSTPLTNKDRRNKEKLWDTPLFMPQDCDKYEWTKRSSSNPVVSRVTTKNGDKIVKQKPLNSLHHDKSDDKNNTANNTSDTAKAKSPPPWIKKREAKLMEEKLAEQKKSANSSSDKHNSTNADKDRSSADKHRDKERKSDHKRSKDSNSLSRKEQDKSEYDKKKSHSSSHTKESGSKSSSRGNTKMEKSHSTSKDHSHEKRKRSRSPPPEKQHYDKYSSSSSKKHKKHRSKSRDRTETPAEKTKPSGSSSTVQNIEPKEEKTVATSSTSSISLKNAQDAELAANYKLMIPRVQIVDIGAQYKKNIVQDTSDKDATSDTTADIAEPAASANADDQNTSEEATDNQTTATEEASETNVQPSE